MGFTLRLRNIDKAQSLADELEGRNRPEVARVDIEHNLSSALREIKPNIVIHTSGPYQGQGYGVAKKCIKQGCHYIDLADAREFVANIDQLDVRAKKRGVLICTGASSVPCLTAAIIDRYIGEFKVLDKIEYGISTAQRTNRGLATMTAVLSYAGKPFTTLIDGKMQNVHGWLGLRWRNFWSLNLRPLGNCDIPDLELFPARYPSLKTIRFQAGLELKALHLVLVMLSWLVKIRVLKSLQPLAPFLLKMSFLFDPFGKDNSGFYMRLSGKDKVGEDKVVNFDLIARNGDGLFIPSMPSILLAKKLANNEISDTGAKPCVDIITLDEYLAGLSEFNMKWQVR
ncbi:MAG: saccharopine dehydrogenase NADP-binding domain-containing protein [Xanthomonadales bacterium]|nr:saccharopine dehydrogenase NADP-binding domain-containing protein [Xanthomonadales bacterium]